MESTSLREILPTLGFDEDWQPATDQQPSYFCMIDSTRIVASQLRNPSFQQVFMFSGVRSTLRTIDEVAFEIPLICESYEQAVAWIVWNLDKQLTGDLTEPEWLLRGREWKLHLPWVRRARDYESRPACEVARDWLRVAARQIRQAGKAASTGATVRFAFDGSALRIEGEGIALVMPAVGRGPWDLPFVVALEDVHRATRRLMQDTIHISAWDGGLDINGHRLPLASEESRD